MKTMRKLSEEMIETLNEHKKKVGTSEALNDIYYY